LLEIIAKNKSQNIASRGNVIQSLGSPITILTVPLGKKAIINGHMWAVTQGAATEARLEANGVRIARWLLVGGIANDIKPESMQFQVRLRIKDLQVDELQTLRISSNSDPNLNLEMKRQLSILELPA